MTTSIADQLVTRAMLSAPYRIRRAYGGQLAGAYAHARSATAQGVLLDKAVDIQAETDRVCTLYRRVLRFVRITVDWGDYRLGQVANLRYDRYDLDDKKYLIVGRQRDLNARTITLTLWG